MAYFTLMASVGEPALDAFRRALDTLLQPTLVSGASHLLGYRVSAQPLGRLLAEAVDGGELLHVELWHPLRPPMFHRPPRVRALADEIRAAWEVARAELPDKDGWLASEVGRLLGVYRHAAAAGECIVTALDHPGDEARARRVRIPWETPSTGKAHKPWWKVW